MEVGELFANPDLEKEGVWVDYRGGVSLKIARLGNPNFSRVYDAKLKPHRRKQRAGTLGTDVETRILCEVLSETVLLDWEGLSRGGKSLKYTSREAFALLHAYRDFRDEVVEYASNEEVFHKQDEEEAAKNS